MRVYNILQNSQIIEELKNFLNSYTYLFIYVLVLVLEDDTVRCRLTV